MIKEDNINCTVEALILASAEPVSAKKISDTISDVTPARIRQGITDLNAVYLGCGSSFRIREIAGGYQFHILPDFEGPIKKMLSRQRTVRLTRAALETLAIIAYRQPATKTLIEHIRGVSCDGVLHNLMERKMIAIAGRSEAAGRPLLYKTDGEFLKFFGLNRISDLPRMEEIEEMIRQADGPSDQTVLPLPDQSAGPVDETDLALGKTEAGGLSQTVIEEYPEATEEAETDSDDEVVPEEMPVSISVDDETDEYIEYQNKPDEDAVEDEDFEPETPSESDPGKPAPGEPVPESVVATIDPDEAVTDKPAAEELDDDPVVVIPAAAEMSDGDVTEQPEYFSENESASDSTTTSVPTPSDE